MKYYLKKHLLHICIILLSLLLLIAAIAFYLNSLNKAFYDTVCTSVEELAVQQGEIVNSYLDSYFSKMDHIVERANGMNFTSMEAAMEWLKDEETTLGFQRMYYVGEDGTLYSSSLAILHDAPLYQSFMDHTTNDTRYVLPFTSSDTGTLRDTSLFVVGFGLKADIQVGETSLVGIVAQCDITQIQSSLVIQSFNNQAYSNLIDTNGDFLVQHNPEQFSFGERVNAVDFLFESVRHVEADKEDVRNALTDDEAFFCKYVDPNGQDMLLCISKVPRVNWGLMISVPYEIFSNQVRVFTLASILIFVILAAVMAALTILLIRTFRESVFHAASAEAKTTFLSTMSHEIRTPLNGIIGLNHLMRSHMDDREALVEYSGKMEQTSQYLLSLINDILDISKLQSGGVQLNIVPTELDELLESVYSMESPKMIQNGIEFQLEKKLAVPVISVDAQRLMQVLINIVSNAAKFTPKGGKVTITGWQTDGEPGNVITTIEVTDTGIGMSPEFLDKIFDPFTQDKKSSLTGQKGTGLGMAISRQLMQAMGGEITMRSIEGEGSACTVTFSAQIAEMPDMPQPVQAETQEDVPMAGPLRLLIAEDIELNAEILLEVLDAAGISADHAADGQQAVELFRTSPAGTYPVILMDMQMPVMDGCEATKAIRRLDRPDAKTVRIFACTANAFHEDEQRARDAGMDDFITKPVDIGKLLEKLGENQHIGGIKNV